MKALTILQPWASAIALGHKRIETRPWKTAYRGPLLIHAGKSQAEAIAAVHSRNDHLFQATCHPSACVFGAIIAVCELVGCVPTDGLFLNGLLYVDGDPARPYEMTDQERALGDYSPGRYGWVLANVRALSNPIPCSGKQGLWTPDDALLAQLSGGTVAAATQSQGDDDANS